MRNCIKYRRLRLFSALSGIIFFFQFSLHAREHLLENGGRFPAYVRYSLQTGSGMMYYTNSGYVSLLKNTSEYDSLWQHIHRYKSLRRSFSVSWHRFDMTFEGAGTPEITAEYPEKTIYRFIKNGKHTGRTGQVRAYRKLTYKNLYPGTDWEIISTDSSLKHNFIIAPGQDPANIRMSYRHAESVSVINGHLLISTSVGAAVEQKPFAFQLIRGDTVQVPCAYTCRKQGDAYLVGFSTAPHNPDFPLIIDPVLVFSTYSGSMGDNFGFTATYDSRSHLYAGGIVDGGTGSNGGPFPVTPGAFQTLYAGGTGQAPANLPCDIGINKYDSAGTTLLYSTYLGGSRDEYPHSLVADKNDNLLIMGTTYSPDFPVDTAAFDAGFNGGTDIFVVKLSEDGSDMLGGTYVGGSGNDGLNTNNLRYNYADDFRGDIVTDTGGNVYVASTTNSTNFPVFGAFQNSRASRQDGVVFCLDSNLRQLKFSTYLGGNGDDAMYSIRMFDTFVYVGGGTSSNAMSFSVSGHKNTFQGGRSDGFIARLNLKGQLLNSTYFGTANYEQIYFLDIDASGRVYAAGQTEGVISRTPGTYGKDKTSQFIVRYTPNIGLINLSTTFGYREQDPEISPSAFLVDKCNNIYFSGWGSPIDYDGLHSLSTRNLQVSPDALQKTTDNNDFYLMVMSRDASSLLYATYYGGNRTEDHVDGGTSRFDKRGVVYQSVCASCPEPGNHYDDFPVSPGAPFTKNLSPRCSNASFKIDFQINFEVDARFTASPDSGCLPLLVLFRNQSKKARQYLWDFGDGKSDTAREPVHLYDKPGTYKVKLTCTDSFSCNITASDSAYIQVLDVPLADFEYSTEECSKEFSFRNKSKDFGSSVWDFGDSTQLVSGKDATHTYAKDGIYKVLLTVKHPGSGCEDTQSITLNLFSNPISTLKIPNVFTPNSDNKNDCYTIGGISALCDEAEIWIYNRWGLLVFNGKLPQECWNGNYKNGPEALADGTYYYILVVKSSNPDYPDKQTVEGVIRLIR